MSKPLRVLIVEDSKDDAELLVAELRQGGFEPTWERVETAEAMEAALNKGPWDLILADYSMPRFDGLRAFKVIQKRGIDLPFIIVSGTMGEEAAVKAMKAGVHDYLCKDNLTRLNAAIERELRESKLREKHRQLKEQLRQSQKLESIGLLAGGVAHDFNNLLSVIIGYTQMMLSELPEEDPLRERLEEIKNAGDRATGLTRQLLAFSRKQLLQPQVLDLNAVVANTDKMLQRLIGEDIDLVTKLGDELEPVMADPGQIEQIIMNLVVNARDAMPEGGKLTIETRNVLLDDAYAESHPDVRPGAHVMIAVTDSGTGMDAETKARIFEPFFTTKKLGHGTGLGLSSVYGIVKQSGGNIWVYSELNRGTTFKVYFPREESAITTKPKARAKTISGGGELILVVEDEEALRRLFENMLRGLGYQVKVAANGGEALIAVEEEGLKPDLLVTDVVMPGMGGRVLAERLRQSQPDLKVLYMSGYTDDAIAHHGVLDPNTPFINKPFNIGDFTTKIRELLDQE